MRKDKKQQKNTTVRQLDFFSLTREPVVSVLPTDRDKAGPLGAELSSRLERQRTLTESILDEIVDYGNLKRAYKQVKSNGGSSGPDAMDVEGLGKWLVPNLPDFRKSILTETYQVSGVRKVEISKPTGGLRILGIPTVKDRLIQQGIHQILNDLYDPYFSTHSYGFRPNCNAHQAVLQAVTYIKAGNQWVVDIDLENFFDKINHDRLMQRLSKGIGDRRLLRLINAYLKAGIMEGGITEQRVSGTPQGSPLSPLLSNIVLDELDKELEVRGHHFCRYADDCNIYVKSRKAGERVLASISKFIETKLKLKVNQVKSGVRRCDEVKFLGYTLLPDGGIRISDKSIDRLKFKVKEITKRNRGVKFEQVIDELNLVVIGWSTYFRLANKWLSTIGDLDGWIRRKLRCYRLKQCGTRYATYKLLRSLGIPKGTSWNVVMYTQGWWSMTLKAAVPQAMSLKWFAQQGLQSLLQRISV